MVLYTYDRRVAKQEFDLSWYGLEGLLEGRPVTLYHGTTKLFKSFDLSRSRGELVNKYYGKGIFLTPDKRVAEDYADANRNIGFDPSIIATLKRKNKGAGGLLQSIYDHGHEKGWVTWAEANGVIQEDGMWDHSLLDKILAGIDGNDLTEIAEYILGSKKTPSGDFGGDVGGPINIFHQSTGLPGYVYDTLDAVGLDSKTYRPKVYTVVVNVDNTLVTSSKSQAKKARSKYDCVVFHGSGIVNGVPEVAVFNPRHVKVRRIEVV